MTCLCADIPRVKIYARLIRRLDNYQTQTARLCLLDSLAMTRAELMRHALSQALRRVHDLAGKKLKLDEEAPMRLPKRGGRQARDQRVINVCFAPEKRILPRSG